MKNQRTPEKDIIASVTCPFCGAAKKERCHQRSARPFGVEHGPACGPHRERLALYRRRLHALRITTVLPR